MTLIFVKTWGPEELICHVPHLSVKTLDNNTNCLVSGLAPFKRYSSSGLNGREQGVVGGDLNHPDYR